MQYKIRSYIAVPIFVGQTEFFGTLCALDSEPGELPESLLRTFRMFADLIGVQLHRERVAVERERFLAVLTHDLRTPLSVSGMVSEVLLRHAEPTINALGDRLARSVRRMKDIVGDAADIARGRFGQEIKLAPASLNAADLVRGVAQEVFGGDPRLHLELDDSVTVLWDRTRVEQLVGNLLSNALQYAPSDAPIRVAVQRDGDVVSIEVANGGRPIEPELLPSLFELFARGVNSHPGGMGMGLFIVKVVAEAHGGSVEVRSDESETCFRATMLAVATA